MVTDDRSHLGALQTRLSHERAALDRFAPVNHAGQNNQRALRLVWIAQIEREIADEKALLGIADEPCDLSDDDLLAELMG